MKKYDELINDGWIDTGIKFAANSAILVRGEDTLLFDKTTDEIFGSYSIKEKPAV